MRLKDVPVHPAYLVFHDPYDKGAMDVRPAESFQLAESEAKRRNDALDEQGIEEAGCWRAYTKLPRVKVWRFNEKVLKA